MIKNVLKFIVFFLISIITNKVNSQTYTQGSVPIGAADGTLSQDNLNLYWDLTNKRLGIKTNTPSDNLQVIGSSRFGGSTTATNTVITANGDIGIGVTPITNMAVQVQRNVNSTVAIRFENTNTGPNAFAALQFGQDINTTGTKFLNIGYGNQALAPYGVYQPQGSFIVNNGTGPLALGAANATSGINFFTGGISDPYKRMTIGANGDVGIGTATPAAKLHVEDASGGKVLIGGATAQGKISLNGTWDNVNWNILSSASDKNLYLNRPSTADMWFRMNNTSQMVLKASGNLGIGIGVTGGVQSEAKLTISGPSIVTAGSVNNINEFSSSNGIRINSANNDIALPNGQDAISYQSGLNGAGAAIAFGRGGSWDTFMSFYTNDRNTGGTGSIRERMRLDEWGNLGIGTTDTKGYRLAVNGTAIFTKVQVKSPSSPFPDYVFKPEYKLRSLKELEIFIKNFSHLPEVPAANDVQKEGLDIAETQAILLRKIEELTLYLIEQGKKNEKLENLNELLQQRLEKLEKRANK